MLINGHPETLALRNVSRESLCCTCTVRNGQIMEFSEGDIMASVNGQSKLGTLAEKFSHRKKFLKSFKPCSAGMQGRKKVL